jgi:hypothetical protein
MLKSVLQPGRAPAAVGGSGYPVDLEPALQETLAILADIDAHYDGARERLEAAVDVPDKERVAAELEERHRQEREPYVLHLAELYQRMMSATMYRRLTPVH